MKKIFLLSFLCVFAFQFAHAWTEDQSFVAEPALTTRLFQVTPAAIQAVAPTAAVPMAVPVSAQKPRTLIYEGSFNLIGTEYLEFLRAKTTDVFSELDPQQQKDCTRRYSSILNDGKIDIRIAFGFFDWSTGSDIITQGLNFGKSPSADLGGYNSMEKMLLTPCQAQMRFCGFNKDDQEQGLYWKVLEIRGEAMVAEIRMSQPSVTEFYKDNVARKADQDAKSLATKEFYMKALQEADMALYIGHSRSGGGPDFNVPILKEDGHANYEGFYQPNKPGLKMMIEALTKSGRQAPIVGLFSCDSRNHFLARLKKAAPNTGFITSTRVDTINNLFAASLGSLDAVLRGQCQKSFYQSLRLDPEVKDLITMDNMFN